MTAFNVVRFRVKPGREQEFLDAHKRVEASWSGLLHANMIKTGERTFCIVAEWTDMDALAKARPNMIATLEFLPRHARRSWRRSRCNRSRIRFGGAGAEIARMLRRNLNGRERESGSKLTDPSRQGIPPTVAVRPHQTTTATL